MFKNMLRPFRSLKIHKLLFFNEKNDKTTTTITNYNYLFFYLEFFFNCKMSVFFKTVYSVDSASSGTFDYTLISKQNNASFLLVDLTGKSNIDL